MTDLGDVFFGSRLSRQLEEVVRQKMRDGLGMTMIRNLAELQGEKMSTSPIGDAVQHDIDHNANSHHEYVSAEDRMRNDYAPDVPAMKENPGSFMNDLLQDQHEFMTAQHQFIQDGDLNALLAAQMNFITAQAQVIKRLGVFG